MRWGIGVHIPPPLLERPVEQGLSISSERTSKGVSTLYPYDAAGPRV
jgi:hypothetical protein